MNKLCRLAGVIGLMVMCGGLRAEAPAEIKCQFPVLDWISIGFGGGGYIQAVGIAPGQPNRMYLAVDVGGIYRSDNGGLSWRPIFAAFTHLAGEDAPRVNFFAVSHQNPDRFFIATESGLWKSEDGGGSYLPITKDFKGRPKDFFMVFNPWNDQDCTVFMKRQFWRTIDGGKTLDPLPNPKLAELSNPTFDPYALNRETIIAAGIHYSDKDRSPLLWVGGEQGVFRSEDNGKTWSACAMKGWPGGRTATPGNYVGRPLAISLDRVTRRPVLMMIPEKEPSVVYRSDDLGDSWASIARDMGKEAAEEKGDSSGNMMIWVDPDNADHFALDRWKGAGRVTEDGGKTCFTPGPVPGQESEYFQCLGYWYAASYWFAPGLPNRMYALAGAFRSDDGGRHFYNIEGRQLGKHHLQSTGEESTFVNCFGCDPSTGDRYMSDHDNGLQRTDDFCRTWQTLKYHINEDPESDFPANHKGSIWWAMKCLLGLVVDDGEKPAKVYAWFHRYTKMPGQFESFNGPWCGPESLDQLGGRRGIYVSADRGASFHWCSSYKSFPWQWVGLFNGLVLDRNSPVKARVFYVAVAAGIFKSADSARTWTCLNKNIGDSLGKAFPGWEKPDEWEKRSSLFAHVRIDPFDSNILYVSALKRNLPPDAATALPGVIRSKDGGQTWEDLKSPISSCWALETSPLEKGWLYASDGHSGVYFSKDYGQTWKRRSDFTGVVAIVPSRRHPHLVYVGNNRGVYRSADDGKTWQNISGEMPHQTVMTMMEDPLLPNWLFVGTRGGGGFMAYDYLP